MVGLREGRAHRASTRPVSLFLHPGWRSGSVLLRSTWFSCLVSLSFGRARYDTTDDSANCRPG